jgi:catechol 2,3-dioxygenase-like lactoylglutathione lyase family enzyme
VTARALTPELRLSDVAAGEAMLRTMFGFQADGPDALRLGTQRIVLRSDAGPIGHGLIDHLALAVDDVRAAMAAVQAKGGRFDSAVTPDGPLFIPEFWKEGTRYVFFAGPEGARIELCARPGLARAGLPGHDHIGIAARDFGDMRRFFLDLGLSEVAATVLERPGGNIPVSFLGLGASVVELYAPPGLADAPRPPGFWRRLILEGADEAGPLHGPEGIEILRRTA